MSGTLTWDAAGNRTESTTSALQCYRRLHGCNLVSMKSKQSTRLERAFFGVSEQLIVVLKVRVIRHSWLMGRSGRGEFRYEVLLGAV
jgi:rhamnogalacturonyl hydrolase YesR